MKSWDLGPGPCCPVGQQDQGDHKVHFTEFPVFEGKPGGAYKTAAPKEPSAEGTDGSGTPPPTAQCFGNQADSCHSCQVMTRDPRVTTVPSSIPA